MHCCHLTVEIHHNVKSEPMEGVLRIWSRLGRAGDWILN